MHLAELRKYSQVAALRRVFVYNGAPHPGADECLKGFSLVYSGLIATASKQGRPKQDEANSLRIVV